MIDPYLAVALQTKVKHALPWFVRLLLNMDQSLVFPRCSLLGLCFLHLELQA